VFRLEWITSREGLLPGEMPATLSSWYGVEPSSQQGLAVEFSLHITGLLVGTESVRLHVRGDDGQGGVEMRTSEGLRLPSELPPISVSLPRDPRSNKTISAFEFPPENMHDISGQLRMRWQIEDPDGIRMTPDEVDANGTEAAFLRIQLERLDDATGYQEPAAYMAIAPSASGEMVSADTGFAILGDVNNGAVSAWEMVMIDGVNEVQSAYGPNAFDTRITFAGPPRGGSNASIEGANRIVHFRRRLASLATNDVSINLVPGTLTRFVYASGGMNADGSPSMHDNDGSF